jgi:hypothetical protein
VKRSHFRFSISSGALARARISQFSIGQSPPDKRLIVGNFSRGVRPAAWLNTRFVSAGESGKSPPLKSLGARNEIIGSNCSRSVLRCLSFQNHAQIVVATRF